MRKSFRYAALAIMLLVALVATACSKSMTLQEYFTGIGDIQKRYDDKSNEIRTQARSSADAGNAGDAAIAAEMKGVVDETVSLTKQTKIELEALKPPAEAKDANEAFVAAFDDLLAAMEEARAAADKATTADTVISALETDALTAAGRALDKACNDLSAIATQNKVTTTLYCADPGNDAQTGLRDALVAAKILFTDTDDYSGVSVEAMAGVEPSLNYVESTVSSTGPNEISIYTDGGMIYAAAALSDSGDCYYMRDNALSPTTFGKGSKDACTGQAAADSANAASW